MPTGGIQAKEPAGGGMGGRLSFTDKNLNGKIDVTNNAGTNEILQVTERSQRVKYDSASSEETAKAGGWAYYAFAAWPMKVPGR